MAERRPGADFESYETNRPALGGVGRGRGFRSLLKPPPITRYSVRFAAKSRILKIEGCRIAGIGRLVVSMRQNAEKIRKDVAAHRARQLAAGRVALNTYVPGELVEAIDRIKEQRGASARAPIIEEALRFYIEAKQGT